MKYVAEVQKPLRSKFPDVRVGGLTQRILYAQQGPRLGNQFLEDTGLMRFMEYFIPQTKYATVKTDLTQFGDKVSGVYVEMARNAELFQPQLEKFDAWGNQVNRLHLSEGWKFFHRESAVEGLVALPYESSRTDEHGRIHQAAKLTMFHPSSGMYSCPLAMTDGASFVLRSLIQNGERREELLNTYDELTTRNPDKFITSGQWMTEKKGGSDVSYGTDTIALKDPASRSDVYSLYGYKWFTSATDSSIALTLARITESIDDYDVFDTEGNGSKTPLSMFLLRTRKPTKFDGPGELNGIEIIRLKDKMGTKQLPTAELVLNGTEALLISDIGKGVRGIAPMLHITRYHNALSSVGAMRRMVNLAKDYAKRRYAFGKRVAKQPLHVLMLRKLDLDTQGNLRFCLEAARLLGLIDAEKASENDQAVLRVMSSLLKVFTAKEGVRITTEGIECFGGVGVMENSQIPVILRDMLILPIWEGTTNILCLDLLRAARREPSAIVAFEDYLRENAKHSPVEVKQMIDKVFGFMRTTKDPLVLEFNARKLTFNMSRLIIVTLLNRMKQENRSEQWKDFDESLFAYWIHRMETEYEEMEGTLPESCIEQFNNMLNMENMGSDRDARGKTRSCL